MRIQGITETVIKNNGGTFQWIPSLEQWVESEYPFGYWVSTPQGIGNLPRLRLDPLKDFIETRSLLSDGITYLGIWNEGTVEHPLWSVDESLWIEKRHDAIRIGLENNQKAIFDIVNNFAVML